MPEINDNKTYLLYVHHDDSENAYPTGPFSWEQAFKEKERLFKRHHVHSVTINGIRYYNLPNGQQRAAWGYGSNQLIDHTGRGSSPRVACQLVRQGKGFAQ